MNAKTTSIVAYITFIGTIIALLAGDKSREAKFHVNPALVIYITDLVLGIVMKVIGLIPIIGAIINLALGIFVLVLWIMGFVAAIKQNEKEVPLVGKIRILK